MPVVWPAAAVGDRYLVTFLGTMFGQRIMNTFHYRLETIAAPGDVETAYSELDSAINGTGLLTQDFLACCPSEYTMDELWIQRLYPSRVVKSVVTVNNPGTATGTATTQNIAAVITRRGLGANRKNVGSLHVPINNDTTSIVNGSLGGGLVTLLSALATEMEGDVTGADSWVFAPILTGGAGANDFEYITEATPRSTVRVMRRRTVGLGI